MPNALVTGGARRLGRAMCLYLAKRGYDLAIHYATSRDEAGRFGHRDPRYGP